MIGYSGLVLSLIITSVTICFYVYGKYRGQPNIIDYGRKYVPLICLFLSVASLWLFYLLLTHDFETSYVAYHTSRDLSFFYTISAFWAGQEGSLLLWVWFLSIFVTIVALTKKDDQLTVYATPILLAIISFFLVVLIFASNPFEKIGFVPEDGVGLNPLLQDPGMWIHPPTTFLGYGGFAVPFAFAMAGLLTEDENWVYRVRRWTLFSWIFLGIGIGLGGWWSYHVLGWGGYWAWDPVENLSLLPWLTSTAFIHSVMIQEGKKGMKVWNILLITFTFILVIYATLLTRSGILQSVHAFGESPITPYFIIFMMTTLVGSLMLLVSKLQFLKSENIFEAYLSKETSFLFNNLIFIVLALVVFIGTSFPLLSGALRGYQVSVGPIYFNQTFLPLAAILPLLAGVCTLIAWRKASAVNIKKDFTRVSILTIITTVGAYFLGVKELAILLAIFISAFVLYAHALEFHKGVEAVGKSIGLGYIKNLGIAIKRNQRKYGGYIVHISIIFIVIGVAWSSIYETSKMFSIGVGESYDVGPYSLAFIGLPQYDEGDKIVNVAIVEVYNNGVKVADANPSISYYPRQKQYLTNVYIHNTFIEELYIIFQGTDGYQVTFEAKIIPLVNFIWVGLILMILGTIVAAWPKRRRVTYSWRKADQYAK